MLNVNSVEPFSVVITSCRSDIVTLKSYLIMLMMLLSVEFLV